MSQSKTLQKTIRLPQLVALYIGAVVGSGVLLVPGLAAEIAGPASLIAWGIMALLVLPMGLTMGLLSARFPHAGGVSHFVTRAFGERWGALVGWFFLLSVPLGVPINGLTASGYLAAAMHLSDVQQALVAGVIMLVALGTNWLGMKVAGQVQVAVVAAIVVVLVAAFAGSVPNWDVVHLQPFMPHGWWSVGEVAAILFWCFIGWEAVSHLSEEFVDPERTAVRGVLLAVGAVGVLYLMAAVATVATGSYGGTDTVAALSRVIQQILGPFGGILAAVTAVFICTATAIAYTGAASRVALALARQGQAPRQFGQIDEKRNTPSGALYFLGACYLIVLVLYANGLISIKALIQLPNATFIATYLGGCLAAVRLLHDSKWGLRCAWISLLMTLAVYPFLGWMGLYPVVIGAAVLLFSKKGNALA
ncbi:APC family permease [Tumebacillus permanentifrigoris]|uniref:Amino acid/polyamine/organocation transporter (APC superfamily) n=1 Tax=Tumebacillus permanentifrigoris TaxID=378543 RepID=A0A316D6K5_9BACL|nr:amino acid permease [Tumebacillus permanentifrigoris]PWK11232.1 amino acid/polyamine/organocation transporter (APC superfamily) [Tumebacillus permanentifrigoris]